MALTAKQRKFAREVASGESLSDSYRTAYNAVNMKPAVIRNEASKLLARPDITMMVERCQVVLIMIIILKPMLLAIR